MSIENGKLNLLEGLAAFDRPVSRITGIGSYVPDHVMDNAAIAERVTAEPRLKKALPRLIDQSTLVKRRRYSPPDASPSDLGVIAVQRAIENAGKTLDDIDTLMFASTDTDQLEPATGNILQAKLGIRKTNSFDVGNACNSCLQAMHMGNSLIAAGAAKCVVVCAAELGSHWVNWELKDRDELRYKIGALTLGDASGAVVLEPSDGTSGITEVNLFALGEYWKMCHVPEDTEWRKKTPHNIHGWFYLDMAGLAKAVRPLSIDYFKQYRDYRKERYGEADFKKHIDKVIPHQISRRLIVEIVKCLHADPDIVAITADDFGNTASAAIPFTLNRTIQSGELQLGSGQDILLFGAASGLGMGHIRLRL